MSLTLTDVRCYHCGRKLCDELVFKSGGHAKYTCPKCHKQVKFEDKPQGAAPKTE